MDAFLGHPQGSGVPCMISATPESPRDEIVNMDVPLFPFHHLKNIAQACDGCQPEELLFNPTLSLPLDITEAQRGKMM